MWTTYDESRASALAGTLRLYVGHVGGVKDEDGGIRKRYGFRISDDNLNTVGHEAYDLYSGVGAEVDPHHALTTLVAFLSAAGEAYRSTMGGGHRSPEGQAVFPDWVNEAAYMNDTELSEIALDLEDGVQTTDARPDRSTLPTPHGESRRPGPPDIPRL